MRGCAYKWQKGKGHPDGLDFLKPKWSAEIQRICSGKEKENF